MIFLREGGSTELDLTGASGTFDVTWLDPRSGDTTEGDSLTGGSSVSLGEPPADASSDWAVFVRR